MLEKWSINRLAEESGMDRRTIKKRLELAEPCDFDGEDPLYHLRTFLDALMERDKGEGVTLEKERTRLLTADADIREIDRAERRHEVVPVDLAFQVVSNMFFSIRRTIETSPLPNEQKDEIFEQMRGLKVEDFLNELKFEEGEDA